MTVCPIECVRSACPEDDWLQKHESFVLTVVGLLGGGAGVLLSYFLKSRCTKIRCFGFSCERQPIALDQSQVEIVEESVQAAG